MVCGDACAKSRLGTLHLAALLLSIGYVSSQLPASSSVNISAESSTGFNVSFAAVPDARDYEVTVTAVNDPEDEVVLSTRDTSIAVEGRRSNINFRVSVKALDGSNEPGAATATKARTAPGGCAILRVIAAPTFLTVFLEPLPGSTSWEVEYRNMDNKSTSTLSVPSDNPSNTHYVAVIEPLNPNTLYSLRARVSQINSDKNFVASQSPYGNATNATTGRLSVFGRVEMITRDFSLSESNNATLKAEIASELRSVYQGSSSNVFSVSVVELEESEGEKTICHHEISLNDQTTAVSLDDLKLNNSDLYRNSEVIYSASSGLGGYKFTSSRQLSFDNVTHCATASLATDMRWWALHEKGRVSPSVELRGSDVFTPDSVDVFEFSNSAVRDVLTDSDVFELRSNTVYAIEQNYLLKTCTSTDSDVTIYDRLHDALSVETAPESSKYTILHTTDLSNLDGTSIEYVTNADGLGVTLSIPSSFVQRATGYEFVFNGAPVASFNEAAMDSSPLYRASISGLNLGSVSIVTVIATARSHDLSSSSASTTIQVNLPPDVNECTSSDRPHNCDVNAICSDTVGSFTCSCRDGFVGNGVGCTDVDECSDNATMCAVNAICVNTAGTFSCSCIVGYRGDGIECDDVDECVEGADTCAINAICVNSPGSFTCTCDSGYNGDGVTCSDVDECRSASAGCHVNARCRNFDGSFACVCLDGFTGSGTLCDDINECIDSSLNDCGNNNICVNTMGGFSCRGVVTSPEVAPAVLILATSGKVASPNTAWMAAPIVIVILAIATSLLVYIWYQRRRLGEKGIYVINNAHVTLSKQERGRGSPRRGSVSSLLGQTVRYDLEQARVHMEGKPQERTQQNTSKLFGQRRMYDLFGAGEEPDQSLRGGVNRSRMASMLAQTRRYNVRVEGFQPRL